MPVIERRIRMTERVLEITFPRSYRQFLIERGTATIEGYTILGIPEEPEKGEEKAEEIPEQGTVLWFRSGDLSRGGFAWISNYEGRIVGLCSLDNCRYCNPTAKEQLKSFKGGELRVNLKLVKRETTEFYVAHFVSFVKPAAKTKKQKQEMSVADATQFLWQKRPELQEKKLVPVCFKTDLNTDKLMALCMDLSQEPKDDAPLVQISDVDDEHSEQGRHDPEFFGEWMAHLGTLEERHKFFKIAFQKASNRNNEVLEKHLLKFFDKKSIIWQY